MKENTADILIIEDDPLDAEFAVQMLKKNYLGENLVHLSNAEKALEFLAAANPLPKLIIMDLSLPGMKGIELLRNIRRNARTKELPVVVLTGSWEERDIIETHMLSVNAYMMKPINKIKLKKIAAIIGYFIK